MLIASEDVKVCATRIRSIGRAVTAYPADERTIPAPVAAWIAVSNRRGKRFGCLFPVRPEPRGDPSHKPASNRTATNCRGDNPTQFVASVQVGAGLYSRVRFRLYHRATGFGFRFHSVIVSRYTHRRALDHPVRCFTPVRFRGRT